MTHKNITLNKFKVRIKSFESFSFVFIAILKSASNYISKVNKNTLTGPANCKKTTRLHAHLPLCTKSRKTNDAKSRKWPKTSIWAIFWRSNISKSKIFLENRFHSNWRPYLVLTSGQKPKKSFKPFLRKNISVWFWADLAAFLRISPNQDCFSKIRLCKFSTFIVP